MAENTNTEREALLELIDAYAEARHIGGCHTYNAKTAAARAKVVASLSVSAGSEPVAHIKEPYTLAEIKAKIASNDYSAEMLLQHAMLLLDGASLSANAGEPVAWMTFTEEGDPDMVFLDRLEACQYCEDDDQPKPLYLVAPPTAQAEGWTKPQRIITYTCPVCAGSTSF